MTGRALWALPKGRVDGKLCPPMLPGKNYHRYAWEERVGTWEYWVDVGCEQGFPRSFTFVALPFVCAGYVSCRWLQTLLLFKNIFNLTLPYWIHTVKINNASESIGTVSDHTSEMMYLLLQPLLWKSTIIEVWTQNFPNVGLLPPRPPSSSSGPLPVGHGLALFMAVVTAYFNLMLIFANCFKY